MSTRYHRMAPWTRLPSSEGVAAIPNPARESTLAETTGEVPASPTVPFPPEFERRLAEISLWERQRLGQDLHDDLGQHLTGIAFMCKAQEKKLRESGIEDPAMAKITEVVNEALAKIRDLSRGLLPCVPEAGDLISSLEKWAATAREHYRVSCSLECEQSFPRLNALATTHLYYIARECVVNAIKHGKAHAARICLLNSDRSGILNVEDDGMGLPKEKVADAGVGLHIMRSRAEVIGGTLSFQPNLPRGTIVTCKFPIDE